jgi:hypothetical protein
MNQHVKHDPPAKKRERLERDADEVRSRLVGDLDELKARGRSVGERFKGIEETLRRHPVIGVAAGAVALVAFGSLLYARRRRNRRARQRDAILSLAARVLGPAYVVEPAAQRPSAIKSSLKQAGSALVGAAGRELGRRALLAVQTRVAEHEQPEDRAPA